jgi:AcrR family transcriptional regulator
MPTLTFNNLPEEKKNIIIEASIKEFKRALLTDASINKIIKDANISRGSFYTYFKDINDLYEYSLNKYKEKIIKIIKQAIKETNGELFETTTKTYEKILKLCSKDKQLFKNIFLNFNYNISIRNKMYEDNIENKYKVIELISKINKDNLNIKTEEELFYIIDMIMGFIMRGLIDLFMDKEKEETVLEKLDKQLEILKRGIYKED